jgi:hypothetical protein
MLQGEGRVACVTVIRGTSLHAEKECPIIDSLSRLEHCGAGMDSWHAVLTVAVLGGVYSAFEN